jgi:alanine racemase
MTPAVDAACGKQRGYPQPLEVRAFTDIAGTLSADAIVRENCFLHVRGNVVGGLTIEPGAEVVVDGYVGGKIANRGGRLVVNNKGLTASITLDGPSESEADAVLKVNLSAIAFNWERLKGLTDAECAASLKCNAYGCGIDQVAEALAKTGCRTFFVTGLPEAKRVRAVAPNATIYVCHGFYFGTGPAFAECNAQPVINSAVELAAWDGFVSSTQWTGGCALNVDTGKGNLGLSMQEAAAIAPRAHVPNHGITLLLSALASPEKVKGPQTERQIALLHDLRRLYRGVPASLAGSIAIVGHQNCHFDLIRAGSVLFGVNPTPGLPNPMLPVVELSARILQVRDGAPGKDGKRRRLAWLSVGHADGFPRTGQPGGKLHAMLSGHRCPVVGRPSLDLLPIDVTDLPAANAARVGEMATLIGSAIGVDEVASATNSTGPELLSGLGSRFHRIYHAT